MRRERERRRARGFIQTKNVHVFKADKIKNKNPTYMYRKAVDLHLF